MQTLLATGCSDGGVVVCYGSGWWRCSCCYGDSVGVGVSLLLLHHLLLRFEVVVAFVLVVVIVNALHDGVVIVVNGARVNRVGNGVRVDYLRLLLRLVIFPLLLLLLLLLVLLFWLWLCLDACFVCLWCLLYESSVHFKITQMTFCLRFLPRIERSVTGFSNCLAIYVTANAYANAL
ncbi:uncharacterized protein [Drosophila virilis]|uniref:uncharacterized protein n=1 Tax=Drosophila virilis TaxID=7244 RepID=UPI0038B24AB3